MSLLLREQLFYGNAERRRQLAQRLEGRIRVLHFDGDHERLPDIRLGRKFGLRQIELAPESSQITSQDATGIDEITFPHTALWRSWPDPVHSSAELCTQLSD